MIEQIIGLFFVYMALSVIFWATNHIECPKEKMFGAFKSKENLAKMQVI